MDSYYKEQTKSISAADKKTYGDYEKKEQAESDLHTLMRAKEIKADKQRMRRAMACAKEKRDELNKAIEG